jgi:predicted acyltransferase
MAQEVMHGEATPLIATPRGPLPGQDGQAGPRVDRPAVVKQPEFVRQRLQSLDVYRGLIMVALAFNGFGLLATARLHVAAAGKGQVAQDAVPFWEDVRYQSDHVEWVGCGFWDLIQPSFMFMVGVAMAFSYAKRRQQGQSWRQMLCHAGWRSLVLILLGIFLMSNGHRLANGTFATNWSLINVLTQIGLGYTFLFLLWGRSFRVQALAAVAILAGTWGLYMAYPSVGSAGIDLATGAKEVGVTSEWAQKHLAGVGEAWHKNANVGHAVDVVLLNLLPRRERFDFSDGGYQTLNFLPSLATMLFGLMCGELLRSCRAAGWKLFGLVAAGALGLAMGWALDLTGICPIIKRIWTPSWAIFSTGWCCLILAGLYTVVDVIGLRRWAFPLVVVGVNSIAIYCMSMTLKPWAARTLQTHLGEDVFRGWGLFPAGFELYAPTVQAVLVGLMFWLVCWWMYRNKVFVRI